MTFSKADVEVEYPAPTKLDLAKFDDTVTPSKFIITAISELAEDATPSEYIFMAKTPGTVVIIGYDIQYSANRSGVIPMYGMPDTAPVYPPFWLTESGCFDHTPDWQDRQQH